MWMNWPCGVELRAHLNMSLRCGPLASGLVLSLLLSCCCIYKPQRNANQYVIKPHYAHGYY